MHQILLDAIRDKCLVTFRYDGETRVVEPHCYGVDTKGHKALRAFQVGKGWRLFHVAEMGPMSMTGGRFERPRPEYNPNDKHMATIYARL
jgi:predicted DNA-binding transcriptional regulator YafY